MSTKQKIGVSVWTVVWWGINVALFAANRYTNYVCDLPVAVGFEIRMAVFAIVVYPVGVLKVLRICEDSG